MGKGKGKNRSRKARSRQQNTARESLKPNQKPEAVPEAVGPAVKIRSKSGKITLDRAIFWTVYVIVLIAVVGAYVFPLIGWVFLLVFGRENPELKAYLSNASALVGFVSIALGVASLLKSQQSDQLLRDVQGTIAVLENELGKANAMLDKMYTPKNSTSPASPANAPWQRDDAKNEG